MRFCLHLLCTSISMRHIVDPEQVAYCGAAVFGDEGNESIADPFLAIKSTHNAPLSGPSHTCATRCLGNSPQPPSQLFAPPTAMLRFWAQPEVGGTRSRHPLFSATREYPSAVQRGPAWRRTACPTCYKRFRELTAGGCGGIRG